MPRPPGQPVKLPTLPEHLITDPSQLVGCLDHIARCPVIGFDTEFVGEQTYRPELCLLQVATPEHLYVIDPFHCGPLDRFWELLLDPGRTTVVHAGREDVRICCFQVGKPPADVFDLQIAAGLVGLNYPIGYGGLVHDLLGHKMSKSETLTDWRRRPLLPAQVRYAFDDIRFLLPAWKKLTERLKRLKRIDWAREEFVTAVRRATGDEESPVEKWRRLKGIGRLDRRQLAVARELHAWREEFAARVNRPARQLLRDDVLVEIARRSPVRADDLASYRGVPRGEVESILEAVRRARALPVHDCPSLEPREADPPPVVLLANLLGVVLSDWCARNKLAANLVASGSDLRALVRHHVTGDPLPDIPLAGGWRATAVLGELTAVLDGRNALQVRNPRSAAPLGFLPITVPPPPPEPDPQPPPVPTPPARPPRLPL